MPMPRKRRGRRGLTYGEWAKLFFKEKVDPETRAIGVERERRSSKKFECFSDSYSYQISTAAK